MIIISSDLTEQGKREVEHAARLLMEGGYHYDINVVFTSRLKRYVDFLILEVKSNTLDKTHKPL